MKIYFIVIGDKYLAEVNKTWYFTQKLKQEDDLEIEQDLYRAIWDWYITGTINKEIINEMIKFNLDEVHNLLDNGNKVLSF